MKRILSLACMTFLIFCKQFACAQGAAGESGNYIVVIGAFSIKENADRLVSNARKKNLNASFEINKIRNLYYVYILETGDKTVAVSEAQRLRDGSSFADTWVYNGTLGELVVVKEPEVVAEVHAVEVKPIVAEPKPIPIDPAMENEEKINHHKFSKPHIQ